MAITFSNLEFLTDEKLNAAFSEERDARLAGSGLFTGGAVAGAVTFNSSLYAGIPGVNRAISFTPALASAPLVSDAAQFYSLFEVAAVGGPNVVASNIRAQASISGAPNGQVWNILGTVDYGGTGGESLLVPVVGQSVRRTWNTGGFANNPQMWGGLFEIRDITGQPSSNTNHNLALEVDLFANGLDDANRRQGIVLVLAKHDPAGADLQARVGMYFTAGAGSSYKTAIDMSTPFSVAGLDFRTSTKISISGHTVWLGNGHDIAFDTAGSNYLVWDATAIGGAGAVVASGNLQVNGAQIYLPNALVVFGGAVQIAASRGLTFGNQTDGAAAQTATMTNAPAAGNPFWIPVLVNGVIRHTPAW